MIVHAKVGGEAVCALIAGGAVFLLDVNDSVHASDFLRAGAATAVFLTAMLLELSALPLDNVADCQASLAIDIVCVTVVGILTIVVAFAFSYFTDEYRYKTVWIAAVAAIAGTMGDLLESKLKRMAGVKDSGSIMPGHGGFLDRFDSMLLAVPFVWVVVYFIE